MNVRPSVKWYDRSILGSDTAGIRISLRQIASFYVHLLGITLIAYLVWRRCQFIFELDNPTFTKNLESLLVFYWKVVEVPVVVVWVHLGETYGLLTSIVSHLLTSLVNSYTATLVAYTEFRNHWFLYRVAERLVLV